MPYVHDNYRPPLDELIEPLIEYLRASGSDGEVNYTISRIVAGGMKPHDGWRYPSLLKAYGTFLAAGQEFYRRMVAPYEDKAKERNGDIQEYK